MTPELEDDPETLRLAEGVSTRMADTAWEQLLRWFWTAKISAIETAPITEIDIADLPYAENGEMIPFVEVFPLGLSLDFPFEDAVWAADEQYCVQPRCRCTETVLSFLRLKDAASRKAVTLRNVPALRYNYRSHATRQLAPGSSGTPRATELLAALQTAHPALDLRLELHHRIMQSLYARQGEAQAQRQLSPEPGISAAPSVSLEKAGRNDPCPCGSGKKFKKCCGR